VFYSTKIHLQHQYERNDELRFNVVSIFRLQRILTIVFTNRKGSIRIISARLASKRERQHFEAYWQQAQETVRPE
jgi:uncharacterized DUF497 family protein